MYILRPMECETIVRKKHVYICIYLCTYIFVAQGTCAHIYIYIYIYIYNEEGPNTHVNKNEPNIFTKILIYMSIYV